MQTPKHYNILNYLVRFEIILFCFFAMIISPDFVSAQTVVKMEQQSGIYVIPCKVNGLNLKFIFDTGASDVSISLTEANFMLKNGYLNSTDIVGSEYYRIANGEINVGTIINLGKIDIGGYTLYNVRATVIHSNKAPLLLGQSVLNQLGKITIDYSKSAIIIDPVAKSNITKELKKTSNTSFCIDKNGHKYSITKIGTQEWLCENLRVNIYRNGDSIPQAKSIEEWNKFYNQKIGCWIYYNSDSTNETKYGKLYNWYAVNDPRGLSPENWNIPYEEDWSTLLQFTGNINYADKILKSDSDWETNDGNNLTGLNLKPSGLINQTEFRLKGYAGFFWSNSENQTNKNQTWIFSIYFKKGVLLELTEKNNGYSVRCIKKNN
ncbi:MAG: hypothetical protein E6Q89_01400 [Bacteroidia bacterium]|nr:MAG: hypothetical protein E6Q89_01400 [Bacteroidia bacterium]